MKSTRPKQSELENITRSRRSLLKLSLFLLSTLKAFKIKIAGWFAKEVIIFSLWIQILNKICKMLCIFEWRLLKPRNDSFNFRFSLNWCIPGTRFTPKWVLCDYSRTYPVPFKYDWRSFATLSTDTGLIWEVCERFLNWWDHSKKEKNLKVIV